ncbi:MAG TPA: transcriptional regulator GutM [Anaerovoracaceae bacterium]|nr:transcriptional regulator GutM [Anaerovoracaceae bacterium]
MFWDIIIIAGVFWIIMSIFSFMQTIQIKNIYKILEPSGKVYFGRDAGFLRTRYIAFAAVAADGTVIDAKLLKASRIITPAKIRPLDHLININLTTIDPTDIDLDAGTKLAVQNLAANFKRYMKGK